MDSTEKWKYMYVKDTWPLLNNLYCLLTAILMFWFVFVLQRPHKATAEEMTKYHSDDYIKFLRSIRPDNMSEFSKQMQRCKSCDPAVVMETMLFFMD